MPVTSTYRSSVVEVGGGSYSENVNEANISLNTLIGNVLNAKGYVSHRVMSMGYSTQAWNFERYGDPNPSVGDLPWKTLQVIYKRSNSTGTVFVIDSFNFVITNVHFHGDAEV